MLYSILLSEAEYSTYHFENYIVSCFQSQFCHPRVNMDKKNFSSIFLWHWTRLKSYWNLLKHQAKIQAKICNRSHSSFLVQRLWQTDKSLEELKGRRRKLTLNATASRNILEDDPQTTVIDLREKVGRSESSITTNLGKNRRKKLSLCILIIWNWTVKKGKLIPRQQKIIYDFNVLNNFSKLKMKIKLKCPGYCFPSPEGVMLPKITVSKL